MNPYESPKTDCSTGSSFNVELWLFVFMFWPALAIVLLAEKLLGRFRWCSTIEDILACFGILVSVCWIYFVVMGVLLSLFIVCYRI